MPRTLFLRIPPIAFLFGELGFRRAAGFFQEQHFEIQQAEPGGVSYVMVVAAEELRKYVAEGLLQFLLPVGADDEWLVYGLTLNLAGPVAIFSEESVMRSLCQYSGPHPNLC